MTEFILNTDDDVIKKLFVPVQGDVILKIGGKNPANYLVNPIENLDLCLTTCLPEHRDALLDARNYLYMKREEDGNHSE